MDFSKFTDQANRFLNNAKEQAESGELTERVKEMLGKSREAVQRGEVPDRVKNWMQNAKDRVESAELGAKAASVLAVAKANIQSATDKESQVFATNEVDSNKQSRRETQSEQVPKSKIAELLELAKLKGGDLSEKAANRIAELYTRHTGRPLEAGKVKSIALKVGVAALVATVIAAIMNRSQTPHSSGGVRELRRI